MGHRQLRHRPIKRPEDTRTAHEICREQTTRADPTRTREDRTGQRRWHGQADQGTWADAEGHVSTENQQLPEDTRCCDMAGNS